VNGAQPLAGRSIVLTRPRHTAKKIAQRIAIAGGTAMIFPTLEIVALPETPQLGALIDRLDEFDLAVFVSANAVKQGWAAVLRHRPWPTHLRCAAVGSATQAALEEQGISGAIAPTEQFDSEALLALPQLRAVAAQRIVIFRGEGGRELLGKTLAQRGAHVEHAVTYRRVRPDADPEPLLRAWRHGSIHAVNVMSGESLGNFYAMLPDEGQAWLRATPVFVPHQRIAARAHELAITQVYLTGPSDDALIDKLIDVLCSTKPTP
jgi:uroporphyrinogen-III synthase